MKFTEDPTCRYMFDKWLYYICYTYNNVILRFNISKLISTLIMKLLLYCLHNNHHDILEIEANIWVWLLFTGLDTHLCDCISINLRYMQYLCSLYKVNKDTVIANIKENKLWLRHFQTGIFRIQNRMFKINIHRY